jgi:signal transduction histidine kinase/CheY-like chemotaxis protein
MASFLTSRLNELIKGISQFCYGDRYFRFTLDRTDEFGKLAEAFNEMAASIVRSVTTPLTICDLDLRIVYMNDHALAVTDRTSADVIDKSYVIEGIYPYGSRFCPITALKNNTTAEVFYEKNSDCYYQGKAAYFTDQHNHPIGYIISSIDVTEMSQKQLDLEHATEAANIANAHKSEFLARMSHELRTPMNGIIGVTSVIETKLPEWKQRNNFTDLSDNVKKINQSAHGLLALLNDILEISNLDSGKVELTHDNFVLPHLLKDIASAIEFSCENKKLTFTMNCEEFTPPAFISDPLRLRQVLMNLLNNAVKFTGAGGKVTFRARRLEQRDHKSLVQFTVSDTGIGIEPEVLRTIFEPFEQGSKQITRNYGGGGLGLAIAQRLLALFGGEIAVKSEVNKGSEFTFAVWLDESEAAANNDEDFDVADKFAGQKALVVDDVDLNRLVLVSLLEEAGFEIDEAVNGAEAVELFKNSAENTYSAVFMDIQMPVMDGYDAASEIRKLPNRADVAQVPIIAISANAFKEDIDKSFASGMNGHYAKPVDMDILTKILRQYCQSK